MHQTPFYKSLSFFFFHFVSLPDYLSVCLSIGLSVSFSLFIYVSFFCWFVCVCLGFCLCLSLLKNSELCSLYFYPFSSVEVTHYNYCYFYKKPNLETPREDEESKPVISPGRKSSAAQSVKNLSQQKPDSIPKEAFRTPRLTQSASSQSTLSEESFDLDNDQDEGVAIDLAPSHTQVLSSLKTMVEEEQFNMEHWKTLDSLRSALQTVSAERPPKDVQLERTVTIFSLASQIAKESIELGILPDGVFSRFGNMDSRAMSVLSDKDVLSKGSALSPTIKRSGKSKFVETHMDEKRLNLEKV